MYQCFETSSLSRKMLHQESKPKSHLISGLVTFGQRRLPDGYESMNESLKQVKGVNSYIFLSYAN